MIVLWLVCLFTGKYLYGYCSLHLKFKRRKQIGRIVLLTCLCWFFYSTNQTITKQRRAFYNLLITSKLSYRIDDTIDTIKNKTDIDLNVIETDSPRIEWNILKRIYLQDEGVKSFHSRLTEFRKIPLEFFVATGKSVRT